MNKLKAKDPFQIRKKEESWKEIDTPLSPEKPPLVRSGANCQERNQTRPSDPQRLALAEAIESEIHLVDVLHHLTELLRFHERGRRRNPLSRRRTLFCRAPRPLGLPLGAEIVDL